MTTIAGMPLRYRGQSDLDDYPTPPWVTRSLFRYAVQGAWESYSCLEPACGRGHMADVLREYFSSVVASDVADYGYGEVRDFLAEPAQQSDWVVTNPPYVLAERFAARAIATARVG